VRRSRWGHSPVLALSLALAALWWFPAATATASGVGEISGVAFKDLNRDGARQPDEPVLSDQQIYLLGADGAYLANSTTDASGRYAFAGLADGAYRVQYASPSWWPLRGDWVATTTGSIFPRTTVTLSGSATADFGWRPIVRSRDLTAPISAYVGETGLRVESFNDVVPAREIYDAVMRGTVGAEARFVTIRFDYSDSGNTAISYQGSPGSYSNYRAVCYDNWNSWLSGDAGVSHEYGHAWSTYYDTVVQQDGKLAAYLKARGLEGDARVNTSYAWNARELVAEDYRQLLGSPEAQKASQVNRDIPPAAAVPGLKEFLGQTFTTPPAAPEPTPPPPSPPDTQQVLSVAVPVVSPTPVAEAATITAELTTNASATVTILTPKGQTVRTLLSGVNEAPGQFTVPWDRKDARGRRVKAGTYIARVDAVSAQGASARNQTSFAVS
jgi:hypothetical protein